MFPICRLNPCLFAVVILAVLVAISPAKAQSTSDLQAQIQLLMKQVQALQQQLQVAEGGATVSTQKQLILISTLSLGLTDAKTNGEVSKLQQFLAQDKTIYPEGLVTGYFGSLTQKAMQRWQARNGIVSSGSPATTGYGVVGPKTRAKLQAITFSSSTAPLTPTPPPPLPPPSPSITPIRLPIPTISSLQPTSGPIGTTVTITGSGFTSTGNTVNFGNGVIQKNVSSFDGKTVTFTIPSYISPYCPPQMFCSAVVYPVNPGSYNVSVTNGNGTSNSLSFIVTSNVPAVTSLNPTSGPIGTTVTITGSGFTATGNKVKFGSLGSENNPKYSFDSSDGKTLVFTVPFSNYLSCWYTNPVCSAAQYSTQPGIYGVSVINGNGTSNSLSFIVTSNLILD